MRSIRRQIICSAE